MSLIYLKKCLPMENVNYWKLNFGGMLEVEDTGRLFERVLFCGYR
jgi:hypothetical protein